jgi:Fe-S-cluster containining protein
MKGHEVIHSARLEGVYGALRVIQAKHDKFETKCIGSGNCCKIGLVISLAECWNIAKNLRRQYWIVAESKGLEAAELWWEDTVLDSLIDQMYEDTWDPETNEQESHCAFYNNGCTIYEYRPMVCRAYGVIAPVQDGVCPRKRLPDGGHELIWDKEVEAILKEFDEVVEKYGVDNPDLDFSIYMPAGVLKFLLKPEELQDLIASTDQKFWMGHKGYKHQISKDHWQTVEIGTKK